MTTRAKFYKNWNYWDNLNREKIFPFFMFLAFYTVKVLKKVQKVKYRKTFYYKKSDLHTSKQYKISYCNTLTSASFSSFCQSHTESTWSLESSTEHKLLPPFWGKIWKILMHHPNNKRNIKYTFKIMKYPCVHEDIYTYLLFYCYTCS